MLHFGVEKAAGLSVLSRDVEFTMRLSPFCKLWSLICILKYANIQYPWHKIPSVYIREIISYCNLAKLLHLFTKTFTLYLVLSNCSADRLGITE